MATHRYIDRICAAAAVLALGITLLFVNGEALGLRPASRTMGYETRLFDASRVHTLDIVIDGWDTFLSTCVSETYSPCTVVIDGEAVKNVGIRGKGNTSLSSVSRMDSDRYSFKIEFDQYESGKSFYGLDKLSLNNLIQDNTMMKDYLTYQMMDAFGVDSPLSSFVWITVNGEDWGLYLAVEGVEDSFLRRNYGSTPGALYKPDSMSFGGGRGNGQEFDMERFQNREERPQSDEPFQGRGGNFADAAAFSPRPDGGRDFGGRGAADVKLQYIDGDPDSYANLFGGAKTEITRADQERLIAALKSLSDYEDLDRVLDVEEVLRYFVVHNFVVNGDSYTGNMIHNYYLHEAEGRLSMIPWDYNLAYGSFQGGSASSGVNEAIDDVLTDRPMQAWIFSDEAYTRQYHQLYAQFLDSVDPAAIISQAGALIAPYVERDPTKFCTREEFEAGAEALQTFCALRVQSVRGQLEGSIPSTGQGQKENPAALVDTGALNLSDTGTMNMGEGMGGPGGRGELPAPGAAGEQPDGQGQPALGPGGFGNPDRNPGGMENMTPPGRPDTGGASLVLLGVSVLVLAAGLVIAFKFKR